MLASGNLINTQPYPGKSSDSTAYESYRVASTIRATLYGISGYNSKSTGQFVQIHDVAALPADAAVPKVILWVPGQSNFSYDTSGMGMLFTNGIVVCNSSTGPTKTIGSADCWFNVLYTEV